MVSARQHQRIRGKTLLDVTADGEAVPTVRTNVGADEVSAWIALQGRDPQTARQWATTMKEPVECVLEDLKHRPARAAALLGPVMDVALVKARQDRLEHLQQMASQWITIAVNPSLWWKAVKALWIGEVVWSHLEKQSEWFHVVEAVLMDINTKAVLGHVESSIRRNSEGETPLVELMSVPYRRPDNPEELHAVADRDDSQVLVLVGVCSQLAVRVHGQPADTLRPTLQLLCEEADHLVERANLDPRARVGMIERLLKRALIKTSPACSPWTWPTALLLGSLMAVGLLSVILQCALREHQWQCAVRALESEPGLQVVRETASWGRREVAGFCDARARDPHEVLKSVGIEPADIVLNFRPYMSNEPVFLGLPRLPLGNPSHPVSVSLPAPQAAPSPSAAPAPAPAPALVQPPVTVAAPVRSPAVLAPPTPLGATDPGALPLPLQQLKTGLEATEFHFEPNSEVLTPDSATAINDTALRLLEMQILADKINLDITVGLRITRSSVLASGAVWQLRHSAVHTILEEHGIRSAAIEPSIIASSKLPRNPQGSLDGMCLRLTIEPKISTP